MTLWSEGEISRSGLLWVTAKRVLAKDADPEEFRSWLRFYADEFGHEYKATYAQAGGSND